MMSLGAVNQARRSAVVATADIAMGGMFGMNTEVMVASRDG